MQIDLKLQQKQTLSHAQIQSLNVLAYDCVELNQFLQDEYLENPLLDYTETVANPAKTDAPPAYAAALSRQDQQKPGDIPCPEEETIQQFLLNQLDMKRYSKAEWALIKYLTNCLDENGYFPFSIEEIQEQTNADAKTISRCLEELRLLEPAGIFSSDLTSCLISQLDESSEEYEPMKAMIQNHMEDMALGRISSISRALNLSTASVRKCMERIRVLNPRPLSGLSSGQDHFVIPDIIYSYFEGNWQISLNDNWVENYHLNDYYIKMMQTAKDPELSKYFEGKLSRVQFLFTCIEQRRKTLFSLAEQILSCQSGFFLSKEPLRPMTMAALSEKLGIHPSTLSRAIKGKYVQYPKGVISCRDLFTASAIPAESQDQERALSQEDIKNRIQAAIDGENKSKPYSDQKLVKLLEEQGISISRRAVTKYRQELGIGSSVDRKE